MPGSSDRDGEVRIQATGRPVVGRAYFTGQSIGFLSEPAS
jgi:hypothetical protein